MERFTCLEPETMLPEPWFAPKHLGKAQQPVLVKGLSQRPALTAAGASLGMCPLYRLTQLWGTLGLNPQPSTSYPLGLCR